MQSVNFIARRFDQLVAAFIKLYSVHPDAEVYALEYRIVLARCMATKIAYGVTYEDNIEHILKHLNQSRASAAAILPSAEE